VGQHLNQILPTKGGKRVTIETQHFTYSISNVAPYIVGCIETAKGQGPHPRVRIVRGNRIGGDVVRGGQFKIKRDREVVFTSEPIINIYEK